MMLTLYDSVCTEYRSYDWLCSLTAQISEVLVLLKECEEVGGYLSGWLRIRKTVHLAYSKTVRMLGSRVSKHFKSLSNVL